MRPFRPAVTAGAVCPRCSSALDMTVEHAAIRSMRCTSEDCEFRQGFPVLDGVPCLIDFSKSIFVPGEVIPKPQAQRRKITGVRRLLHDLANFSEGPPRTTERCARTFLRELATLAERPRVLIVGGGTIGIGAGPLTENANADFVGSDVYTSDVVDVLLDGHDIPYASATFHGVWIQAVLEHVLDPNRVVAEIHRVLVPRGVVYAGTPFMQQVHMAAYDFQRFTLSGHRWLFRRFLEVETGITNGAGRGLVWSIHYFLRALFRTDVFWMPLRVAFGWLGRLDAILPKGLNADAASGTYFIGKRSDDELRPRDILEYFRNHR